jgi:hypothetical protein
MNQIVACPEPGCEVAAEVVKVFCLHGHARTLLTAWMATPPRLTRDGHRHPSRWN